VNQSAFQKVFRSRFDEGRSNTSATKFAYSEPKQQFLTDFGTPYLKSLKKNQESFYNTPLFKKSPYLNIDITSTLKNAFNFPIYDFPFLLSQTSDLIRYS
jgi:hypothetical protein